MDKAELGKSKSSNSSITSKERVGNKSRSMAQVKMMPVKKRGVYVENQEMKDQPRFKAPPRSRPGTKKFLASVLTILSKSTTATQHPETLNETPELQKKPHRKPARHNKFSKNIISKIESKIVMSSEWLNTNTTKKKKPKYRSRILNEELNKEASEKVLVLKSKKKITQTPSNYSKSTKDNVSNHSIKWAEFLPTGETKAPKNLRHTNERVAKCIEKGNELNMQRQMLETTTLVSYPEKDDKLYNIFVNLLETVVNDGKRDTDVASSVKTAKSSKIHFEIDDKVATKLYKTLEKQKNLPQYSQHHNSKKTDEIDRNKRQLAEYYFSNRPLATKWSETRMRPPRPMRTVNQKWKPRLSQPTYPKQPASTKTQSEIMQERRSHYKKTKKKDLLNALKQQLWMDKKAFDEPDNFYQALRVMAESKRRRQKSIQFDVPSTKKDGDYDSVCRFKRRKVISTSKNVPVSKTCQEQEYSRVPTPAKQHPETYEPFIRCVLESSSDESTHSLEVYGFDYETKRKIVPDPPSDYSDTDTVNEGVKRINNWNRGFRTITQIWNQ